MFFLYFRFQPLFDVINFLIGYTAGTREFSSDTDQLPCRMRGSSRRLIELLGSLSLILGFSRANRGCDQVCIHDSGHVRLPDGQKFRKESGHYGWTADDRGLRFKHRFVRRSGVAPL